MHPPANPKINRKVLSVSALHPSIPPPEPRRGGSSKFSLRCEEPYACFAITCKKLHTRSPMRRGWEVPIPGVSSDHADLS
mmetsp:Transcript_48999/g.118888  ORF Transcript_48999/g.118888 Transcript_48999/m.118888 type:complete len:80 (-) Transcript_48999:47-286(-)